MNTHFLDSFLSKACIISKYTEHACATWTKVNWSDRYLIKAYHVAVRSLFQSNTDRDIILLKQVKALYVTTDTIHIRLQIINSSQSLRYCSALEATHTPKLCFCGSSFLAYFFMNKKRWRSSLIPLKTTSPGINILKQRKKEL